MKRTFVRLSRAKSASCWLRSGEKSSISKGSRPTCIRVIANCKIDFGRHLFTAHHCREYKKSGEKLDMGKGCVRFKSLEDLALDVVGNQLQSPSAEDDVL